MRVVVALLFVSSMLAGCTASDVPEGDGAVSGGIDEGSTTIAAGKGALEGLLVDDRFRPIHLTNDPITEFDATGFLLLQETGQQVQTDENGEFAFLDLDPGDYTIRASIDGHEATPQPITVEEQKFAETSVIARRVASTEGAVITQEFSVFIPCNVGWVVQMVVYNCATDLSGDNYRPGFYSNFSAFPEATALVAEMKANQDAVYSVQVREDDGSSGGGARYAVARLENEDYVKMTIVQGVKNEEHDHQLRNEPWQNDGRLHTIMFPGPPLTKEVNDVVEPFCNEALDDATKTVWETGGIYGLSQGFVPQPKTCGRSLWGAGVGLAYEARFVQSVFLGEPEVDIESYCVVCE